MLWEGPMEESGLVACAGQVGLYLTMQIPRKTWNNPGNKGDVLATVGQQDRQTTKHIFVFPSSVSLRLICVLLLALYFLSIALLVSQTTFANCISQ